MSAILCLIRAFFNSGKSQISQGAKSVEQGGWSNFVMYSLARNSRTYHAEGNCHGGQSTCQARVRVLSSEQIPISSSSAICFVPNLRSERTKVRTLFTFASVLSVLAANFFRHLEHLALR
jgi:hypothetical protein